MVRISNWFVAFLNFCSLLLGLAAVGYATYVFVHGGSACQKPIHVPLLISGLLLTTISILGFVGSFSKHNSVIITTYLLVVFLLIFGFVIFTAFADIASREDHSSGNYGLKSSYSRYLKKIFVNEKNWNKIRSCLIDAKICDKFDMTTADMAMNSYGKNVSPIQLGCCMFPTDYCGPDQNKNATATAPEIGGTDMQGSDGDCFRWSDDRERQCYYCNSCKNGVLEEIKRDWRFLVIGGYGVVILLIIMFCAACCAKINIGISKTEDT